MVSLSVAVDVGGTFTDLVAFDSVGGVLYVVKVRSTPRNPEEGFIDALRTFIMRSGLEPHSIHSLIHVNTIGTNLLRGQLGLKIPKTALVTTRGFRDVLEIGRQNRPELYNIFYLRPPPLVPRGLRFEVDERVDSRGRVIKSVDEGEVEKVAEVLVEDGVESVAVSFLNSYANPVNERKAKEVLVEKTGLPVTASHEVDSEHREFERTSTAVVNAVLRPVVSRYFERLLRMVVEVGVRAPLQVMSSAGGLVDMEMALEKPVACIESGPSAGVIGAAELAKQLGLRNVISLDMGGTTAKAGAVVNGQPLYVPEIEVGGRVHMGRYVKGSGYPVRYTSVDLAEVSAGGGTIIDVDDAGGLRVGPMSAGADPGPACYGAGGTSPTITDANLFLGRLESLLGGEFRLRKDLAENALTTVGRRIGWTAADVAAASLTLVNLHMARAVHLVSLERGYNPAEFVLMAFGGAGPMHAAELAQQIGITTVVVPPHPGLFTSLGLLMTDFRYTYVRGVIRELTAEQESFFEKLFAELEADASSQIVEKGFRAEEALFLRSLDMRYYGQGYELEVEVGTPFKAVEAVEKFERLHDAVYGFKHEGEAVEVTAVRLSAIIPRMKPRLRKPSTPDKEVRKGLRKAFFDGQWIDTPIYWRESLPAGFAEKGPAIVEEYDSTTVIPPGWKFVVDETGCVVVRKV